MLVASSGLPFCASSIACLTAARSSGEVTDVLAVASGGLARTTGAVITGAAKGMLAVAFLEVSASPRLRSTPEGGIEVGAEIAGSSTIGVAVSAGAMTCAATFPFRGPALAGRGRGNGISPLGGAALASPTTRAAAIHTKISRTAFTSTYLPPRLLPSAIEGKVFGRRTKKTPKAGKPPRQLANFTANAGLRVPSTRMFHRSGEMGTLSASSNEGL
jgi:hypothetical protein